MPIVNEGGCTIATGLGVNIFQLLAVRGALRLEKVGLRSRGGSIRKGWALRLGLPARATHDEVIARIESELTRLHTLDAIAGS